IGVVMLLVRERDGSIVGANHAASEFYGYSREQLCRMNIADINQLPRSEIAEKMAATKRDGRRHFVFPHKLQSGQVRIVDVYSHSVAVQGSDLLLSIIHDISDRVRAERALVQSEAKFSKAFHASPDSININRLEDGLYLEINEGFTRTTGYTPEDVSGRSSMSSDLGIWANDSDRERLVAALRKCGEADIIAPFRRKDGSVLIGAMSARIIDIDGVPCVLSVTRDITERAKAEEQVRSIARFPDEDPHPVMRVSPDGTLLYANKASSSLVSAWIEGMHEDFLRVITEAQTDENRRSAEVRGGDRIYQVTIVPLDAGYINLYGRDITEEKSLAAKLSQAQKMEAIGRLAGGIAHDFNNLLQVISGYCDLLILKTPAQTGLAEIAGAARRAASLTAQLLAFSRKQVLTPRPLDVKDLIGSLRSMLERLIGEDIEVRTFVHETVGSIWADRGQIEQVLLNLAVNARDAMPMGGTLIIEASGRTFDERYVAEHPEARAGRFIGISMSDTGCGMDAETMSHLYEPFFTTKPPGKGTGLGLSTVFGIVKQSGGHITCYSEPSKGTTFTVYLPQSTKAPEDEQRATARAVRARGGETILLVEDEPSVRRFVRIVLESGGYAVIEAASGDEALVAAAQRKGPIQLLVTDVVMPRMGGKELAGTLAGLVPGLRVLFVSGYTPNAIVHLNVLDPGVDLLQKPFGSQDLLTKVREILDRG
ncbi:MAG TPA: PAS domain S-box protein, partial [Spirochaetia bacterium]